jgi:hypothetical protein
MNTSDIPILTRKEHLAPELLAWTVRAECMLNNTNYPAGRPMRITAKVADIEDVANFHDDLRPCTVVFEGHIAEYNGTIRYIYSHMEKLAQ